MALVNTLAIAEDVLELGFLPSQQGIVEHAKAAGNLVRRLAEDATELVFLELPLMFPADTVRVRVHLARTVRDATVMAIFM